MEVVPGLGHRVDIPRLRNAWRAVVRRHSILRALLLEYIPGSSCGAHLILNDPLPTISYFETHGGMVSIDQLRERYDPSQQQECGLSHHLSICRTGEGKVYICLDINHTLSDGHSRSVLWRDLLLAYSGQLSSRAPSYGKFIDYIGQVSQDGARRFWKDYLKDVEPCYFPSLTGCKDENVTASQQIIDIEVHNFDSAQLRSFCRKWELTPATIVRTAWALVLARYTGAETPCFGSLCSGRDLPIEDVAEIVGPMIGMLACRVQLGRSLSVLDTLRAVQDDYIISLEHQTFPLSEVHRVASAGESGLFNTVVSIQKPKEDGLGDANEVDLVSKLAVDPTEVSENIPNRGNGSRLMIRGG